MLSYFASLPLLGRPHQLRSPSFPNLLANGLIPANPAKRRRRCCSIRAVCEAMEDEFYMRRCVEIARRALGSTSPNPMVGCVIVDEAGEIVGEGFHPKAGQPHAEVFALMEAGVKAENATAYVSLEPCNHYGRTPPCTEALILAKVKRVVVGMVDPNPIVASKGVQRLRDSGIEVTVGVEEPRCRNLNEAYIHRMVTGKPFLTLRYSLSLNGRIMNGLVDGSEAKGGCYSRLLQEYDGVIISRNLLATLSTLPASEEPGAKQPLCIAIAAKADLPSRLPCRAESNESRTATIFTDKDIAPDPELGRAETVVIRGLTLSSVLDHLSEKGLCSVLLDLRGEDHGDMSEMLANAVDNGLLQKVVMEIGPFWDDGKTEPPMLDFWRRTLRLRDLQCSLRNGNVVVEGYAL